MRTSTFAFAAASLLAVNSACIAVDTEIPHVCVQEDELVIPVPVEALDPQVVDVLESLGIVAPPPGSAPNMLSQALGEDLLSQVPTIVVQESFTPDGLDAIPNALDDVGADGALRLLGVTIGGTAKMFEGVERVSVMLTPGEDAGAFEPVELAVCDPNAGCDVTSDELQLASDEERDLLPLLRHEGAELVLELVARPTVMSWTLDVEVCMGAEASITVSP